MPSDSEMTFLGKNRLLEYIVKCGVQKCVIYSDGALIDPVQFPLAAVETEGAVLFADLPGFSGLTAQMGAMEAAYYASHFFAWFEGEAGRCYGGIVDKFIGDEVMMVFARSECRMPPFRAALCTARAMLGFDPYAFEPKIGIAAGPLAVALIGTQATRTVSAIGRTVNLAARCVQSAGGPKSIRVVTDDLTIISELFQDQINEWDVQGPTSFKPRNMDPVQVVDIYHKVKQVPNFDFLHDVHEMVKFARDHGVVIRDTGEPCDHGASKPK